MKAITYKRYGPPDVLQLDDVQKPEPREDEVLVRIHAASINFGDRILMKGKPFIGRFWSGLIRPKYPILGTDIAGKVEKLGAKVKGLKPGDEVFADIGDCGFGAYAEYVSVPENVLTPKPANITFEQAAAVPQAAVVALQGLRDKGQVRSGQKVLINGASGGVGQFAVQIARSFGTEVTGVCSAAHVDLVKSLGVDHVIDYRRKDFTRSESKYDLILNIVANRSVSDYAQALNPQGVYVAVAFNPTALLLGPILSKKDGKKIYALSHRPNPDDLAFIKTLLKSGKVIPLIDRCFSLAEVPQAMHYLEGKSHHGKVVISVVQDNSWL